MYLLTYIVPLFAFKKGNRWEKPRCSPNPTPIGERPCPDRVSTPPTPTSFPVRKIIGDTLFSSLIYRFAVYTRTHHRWHKWHPRFWTNAFSQNRNGRFQGCKVRVAPYFSHWPLFSKGKKGIKKGILKDVPYFEVSKKLINMVSPCFILKILIFRQK